MQTSSLLHRIYHHLQSLDLAARSCAHGTGTCFTGPQTYPVVIGGMDTAGNLVSNIIHQPTDELSLKFSGQTQGAFDDMTIDLC